MKKHYYYCSELVFGVHEVRETIPQVFVAPVECGKQKVRCLGERRKSFRASIFLSLNLLVPIKFCLFQVLHYKNSVESVDQHEEELENIKAYSSQSPDLQYRSILL